MDPGWQPHWESNLVVVVVAVVVVIIVVVDGVAVVMRGVYGQWQQAYMTTV